MNLEELKINKEWTLFLDRDGVINKKVHGGYVIDLNNFEFLPNALEAICILSKIFNRVIVVTNQQGVGKNLMTEQSLNNIHAFLIQSVEIKGGKIDRVYYAVNLEKENSLMRKPNIGMALQAKKDFPEIDFSKSVMIGDSVSDITFGKNSKMVTVIIHRNERFKNEIADFRFDSLFNFTKSLQKAY